MNLGQFLVNTPFAWFVLWALKIKTKKKQTNKQTKTKTKQNKTKQKNNKTYFNKDNTVNNFDNCCTLELYSLINTITNSLTTSK